MVLDQERVKEEDFRNCGQKRIYEAEASPRLSTNSFYVKRRKYKVSVCVLCIA